MRDKFKNTKLRFKQTLTIKNITIISMFIGVAICLRFITIPIGDMIRFSFGFIAIAIISLLYGPAVGAVSACISDIIGYMLIPYGLFFPGFTISAAMGGLIYGLFLYRGKTNFARIFLATLTVGIIVNVILNSLWLTILYGYGFLGLLPARIIKNAISVPVNAILLYLVLKSLKKYIDKIIK